MMNAMIRRAGHSITIKESTETSCTLTGRRADNGDSATTSYTLAEAQKAGLVKPNGGWTKNPKDMCFARAMSRLARQLFSDVIGIGYIEGEIKATECEVVIPDDILHEPIPLLVPRHLVVGCHREAVSAIQGGIGTVGA